MNQDIEQAIETFRKRAAQYAKNERYYRGDHDLAFATEKFANAFGSLFREFALNLCPAVCDAVRDKLRITGFGVQDAGSKSYAFTRERTTPSAKTPPPLLRKEGSFLTPEGVTLTQTIDRIWDANRMGVRAGEVHKEVLKNGDAYMIVWPNENGEAVMYPNRASSCAAFYDEENPGRILWAAKYWRLRDKRIRLNLFYPDRIEKYVSKNETETFIYGAGELIPFGTSKMEAGIAAPTTPPFGHPSSGRRGDVRVPTVVNPFGVVPVFHFANNSDIGEPGVSELEQAIPVQDGLNKSVLDMLVAMEYAAYRQRWVAGIELETDKATGKLIAPFKAGIDHLWISENPEARFGDFDSANLEQFLKVKDSFRIDVASVTGTPLNYLQPQTKSVPSGESLRRAESRFVAKVRDRQAAFGQVWADAMEFALRIEGASNGARLITQWEDPASYSERELLENELLRKKIGGMESGEQNKHTNG